MRSSANIFEQHTINVRYDKGVEMIKNGTKHNASHRPITHIQNTSVLTSAGGYWTKRFFLYMHHILFQFGPKSYCGETIYIKMFYVLIEFKHPARLRGEHAYLQNLVTFSRLDIDGNVLSKGLTIKEIGSSLTRKCSRSNYLFLKFSLIFLINYIDANIFTI